MLGPSRRVSQTHKEKEGHTSCAKVDSMAHRECPTSISRVIVESMIQRSDRAARSGATSNIVPEGEVFGEVGREHGGNGGRRIR